MNRLCLICGKPLSGQERKYHANECAEQARRNMCNGYKARDKEQDRENAERPIVVGCRPARWQQLGEREFLERANRLLAYVSEKEELPT